MNNQAISRWTIRKSSRMHESLLRLLRQNEGLSIVEYAIAAGLIAVAIAGSFAILGTTIDAIILFIIAGF